MKRSKPITAWLALLLGSIGIHRFYLFGWRDVTARFCMAVTALGVWGVERMLRLGQDDRLSWLLIPILGAMLSYACAIGIYHGLLRPDVWYQRYVGFSAPGLSTPEFLRWPSVLAAMVGLFVGGTVFIATLSFGISKLFEFIYG